MCFPVIRKDLILVDGQLGSCKTDVTVGQQLQQLEPVSKSKGPRAVSLQVCAYVTKHMIYTRLPCALSG